jgi:peptide-methionine (R)-S-oxide reductase
MDIARRVFAGVALTGSVAWMAILRHTGSTNESRLPPVVRIAEFDAAGRLLGIAGVASVRRSDAEWKKLLAVDQYTMTRRDDTELAFAGEYWNFHGDGLYRCVCCGTALFDSETKFSSGTGWPSFSAPVAKENVAESADRSWGMLRTAVRCKRCDGHLGHVFDDGPPPTGLRYCTNSVALRFVDRYNLT